MEVNQPDTIKDNDEIDLYGLILNLWNHKIFIAAFTSFAAITTIFVLLLLPNIYSSYAVLAPEDSNSGNFSQFSGIASMAGISLPDSESNQAVEAVGRVKSYNFFITSIMPEINLEDLMAVTKWNSTTNVIQYDKRIFDSKTSKWVRKNKSPKPSSQEAYLAFKEIMSVSEDMKTKFVTISIDHQSPIIAQQWVALVVESLNESMRNINREVTLKSIDFLDEQLRKINYEGVKKSISNLQEEQIKKLMTIEAKDDFIFKIIEPPYAPELKARPKRLQIAIIGTIIGFILSIFILVIYSDIKKRLKNQP